MHANRTNKSNKMSKKSHLLASAFEGLESRQMMDATPTFYTLNGTPRNYTITVPQPQNQMVVAAATRGIKVGGLGKVAGLLGYTDKFTININGVVSNVTIPATQRIRIQGLDGNDRAQLNGSPAHG